MALRNGIPIAECARYLLDEHLADDSCNSAFSEMKSLNQEKPLLIKRNGCLLQDLCGN